MSVRETTPRPRDRLAPLATFPTDDRTLAVLFRSADDARRAEGAGVSLVSGRPAEVRGPDPADPAALLLAVEPPDDEVAVDQVLVAGRVPGPRFVPGVRSPLELKVPHLEPRFPYRTTLDGVHVSVSCCTGCDGGIHDRGLVVLDNHSGGSWSGIWVHSDLDMPADYARWQKVVFLGGVLTDESGSTTVRDDGWMRVRLAGEVPHEAPEPAVVSADDVPLEGTRSLLAHSLDAAFVELRDVRVLEVRHVDPVPGTGRERRLPRAELRLTDASAAQCAAWLYQPTAFGLAAGDRLSRLRGFLHAEAPGRYVLLGDKEEDLVVDR